VLNTESTLNIELQFDMVEFVQQNLLLSVCSSFKRIV